MFGIGTVANMAQVSVRTLRYYDETGLLRPWWVDPESGYRWYSAGQIHRLHRILALRDLGVSLADIAVLLESEPSVEELRGILLLRRAEAHDRMTAEAARLARVEARLNQLEEPAMTTYDIVTKAVEPIWAIATDTEVADVAGIVAAHGEHWPHLHAVLDQLGVGFTAPSIALETPVGDRVGPASHTRPGPIRLTLGLPVPESIDYTSTHISTRELPGFARVASTVVRGVEDFKAGFDALERWIRDAGETQTGELREVYLDCDGPRDTWVTELQLVLETA